MTCAAVSVLGWQGRTSSLTIIGKVLGQRDTPQATMIYRPPGDGPAAARDGQAATNAMLTAGKQTKMLTIDVQPRRRPATMAHKSKMPSNILVLSPKIEAAIIKGLAPETAISSAEIHRRGGTSGPWRVALGLSEFQEIETRLESGDTEGDLLAAMTAIGKMSRQNHMLTLAIAADKRAISAETAQKELKRHYGNHQAHRCPTDDRQRQGEPRSQLWPQYEPLVSSKEIKAKVACKSMARQSKTH